MKLRIRRDGATRFYYPDLQIICESNSQTSAYQDSPVMIVEVLSPSTRQYDLDEKMQAYLQISTFSATSFWNNINLKRSPCVAWMGDSCGKAWKVFRQE